MSNDVCAGVLLAAGKGKRFGGDKGLALLPDGTAMALRSAQNLRHVVSRLVCVVRPGDTVLHNLLTEHGFDIIVAEQADWGMSASLQAGINALPDAAGWMVALADMPLIKSETYQQLLAAFAVKQQIIMPFCQTAEQYQGESTKQSFDATLPAGDAIDSRSEYSCRSTGGHPVIFPRHYKSDLMTLRGDKGAKAILQQHEEDIQRVWVDDPGILQDFDTRQALNRLFIQVNIRHKLAGLNAN